VFNELIAISALRFAFAAKLPEGLTRPGIYAIRHIPSGRIYIGSGCGVNGIRARFYSHRKTLEAGRHKNKILQNFYDKYGAATFEFVVVGLCERAKARALETEAIRGVGSIHPRGFNINPEGIEKWGQRLSDSTKKHLARINQKPFRLQFGEKVFEGENLTQFCRERGLHQGAMTQVNLGKKHQFKGWTRAGERVRHSLVIGPDNMLHEIPHHRMAEFARKHGIRPGSFTQLCGGRLRYLKGWRSALRETTHAEALEYVGLNKADVARKNGVRSRIRFRRPDQSFPAQ